MDGTSTGSPSSDEPAQLRVVLDEEGEPTLLRPDPASLDERDDGTAAEEAMSLATRTADAPWTVVQSNDDERARLGAVRRVLHRMPYADEDPEIVPVPDPVLVGSAGELFEDDDRAGPLFSTV